MLLPEDTEGDREIVDRSLLPQICGCEIHGDTRSTWEGVSTIFQGTAYSLTTLLYSSITESYDREVAHTGHDIDLYFDELSTDTSER